jgi:hypothetical protein
VKYVEFLVRICFATKVKEENKRRKKKKPRIIVCRLGKTNVS